MEHVMSQEANETVYRFSDFTQGMYKSYLTRLLKEGYEFSFYHTFNKESKFVLWRHDVDFSPKRALELAAIEKEAGVVSTFFIQPHSRFYHLLEKSTYSIFMQIREMGHELGLHFDTSFYPVVDETNIDHFLFNEKALIDTFFGTDIRVFSFHNPTDFALNLGSWERAGMINTYSKYFRDKVTYGSDSNGIWRHKSLVEILTAFPNNLQFLTHPVWWTEEVTSPKQRVISCIEGRAKEDMESQLKVWESWGRKIIDW